VRAGTQRQMDVHTIRKLLRYCGQIRGKPRAFHYYRSNIEFMVIQRGKVNPLIAELEKHASRWAARLKARMSAEGLTLKRRSIRRYALACPEKGKQPRKRFVVKPHHGV